MNNGMKCRWGQIDSPLEPQWKWRMTQIVREIFTDAVACARVYFCIYLGFDNSQKVGGGLRKGKQSMSNHSNMRQKAWCHRLICQTHAASGDLAKQRSLTDGSRPHLRNSRLAIWSALEETLTNLFHTSLFGLPRGGVGVRLKILKRVNSGRGSSRFTVYGCGLESHWAAADSSPRGKKLGIQNTWQRNTPTLPSQEHGQPTHRRSYYFSCDLTLNIFSIFN